MKIGSLTEHYLKNSIFRYISKLNKDLQIGSGIGNDYSFSYSDQLITADGFGELPEIAWNKALNNFLCSFGIPKYARIGLFLPASIKDSDIKSFMDEFSRNAKEDYIQAKEDYIQIVGGDSKVSNNFNKPCFYVTIIGNANSDYSHKIKQIQPEDKIILVGNNSIVGTKKLIEENWEQLTDHFSINLIHNINHFDNFLTFKQVIKSLQCEKNLLTTDIEYLHDISDGGVYKALWELGERINHGIWINNKKIILKQEIIEICEYLNKNPYYLDGSGCLLIVCKNGKKLIDILHNHNIQAQIIGYVTDNKEKKVEIDTNDIRTLSSIPES